MQNTWKASIEEFNIDTSKKSLYHDFFPKLHSKRKAKKRYLEQAQECSSCSIAPKDLKWFYFYSPRWTWENNCGRAGWITKCPKCGQAVDFFLDFMS